MKENFRACLAQVLQYEGGYVNHPADPGGATNKGVTQAVYNAWRKKQGRPTQSVKRIAQSEVEAIYRQDYWDKVRGDDLPAGVDLAVFDFAVNSGVTRAINHLQWLAGVAQDGKIGPKTLAAVEAYKGNLNVSLCSLRLKFLRGLPTWRVFGKGWTARVESVIALSEEMRKDAGNV